MTFLSAVCPRCEEQLELDDRFCQECGLNLQQSADKTPPVFLQSAPLSSPLLGRRTLPKAFAYGTPSKPAKLKSVRRALPFAIGAELLLVAAMFAYTGVAIFYLDHKHSDLMHVHPVVRAAKANKPASKPKPIVVAYHKSRLSNEILELLTRARLLERQREEEIAAEKRSAANANSPRISEKLEAHEALQPQPSLVNNKVEAAKSTPPAKSHETKIASRATGSTGGEHDRQISDVAEYNRLLAEYFSRRQARIRQALQETTTVAPTEAEPPSYQEWIDGNKPGF